MRTIRAAEITYGKSHRDEISGPLAYQKKRTDYGQMSAACRTRNDCAKRVTNKQCSKMSCPCLCHKNING